MQKCYLNICRGSLTLLVGTASHCVVRDDGCLEDTSVEVLGRLPPRPPMSGSGSDRQEDKGLGDAEAV